MAVAMAAFVQHLYHILIATNLPIGSFEITLSGSIGSVIRGVYFIAYIFGR